MIRVFIAAPYWNDNPGLREANVFRAKAAAAELMRRGYAVYCPHLMHYMPQKGITEEMWKAQDLAWLLVSERVFRLPGASAGADNEVGDAGWIGIPVSYSLDDFPNLLEEN